MVNGYSCPSRFDAWWRSGVAMIYQELSLGPHLTVAENSLLGMEPTRSGLRAGLGVLDRGRDDAGEQWLRSRSCIITADRLDAVVGRLSIAAQQIA